MSRKYFVCGKMERMTETKEELIEFFNKAPLDENTELVLVPVRADLEYTASQLTRRNVTVAAEHLSAGHKDDFSAQKVKDSGGQWVIVGHWKRRQATGETYEALGGQVKAALEAGLKVMVCVGDGLKEREMLQTQEVLGRQMGSIAESVEDWERVVVVYQPGWAEGTCKLTTPREVQRVHCDLRHWLATRVSPHTADTTRIIFGGVVHGNNVAEMAYREGIDGFLAFDAAPSYDFLKIVNARN